MTTTETLEREVVFKRYYDPATGQFLSVDPLVASTQQPYAYASDNPGNESDPTGLKSRSLGTQMAQPPANSPLNSCEEMTTGQSYSYTEQGGMSFNLLSLLVDAGGGYASGLEYRATALSAALREGSSYAGGNLRSAGEAADAWEPLADAAPALGMAITFGTDIANGEGFGQATANALGVTAGGYVGVNRPGFGGHSGALM